MFRGEEVEIGLGVEKASNTKKTMVDKWILTPMVNEVFKRAVQEIVLMKIEVVEGVKAWYDTVVDNLSK